MKTEEAIRRAGGKKELADLLGISLPAIYQWKKEVPQPREWQLRLLRPAWFRKPREKAGA